MIIKGRDVLSRKEVTNYFISEFDEDLAADIDMSINALSNEYNLIDKQNIRFMVIMENANVTDVLYCKDAFEFDNVESLMFDKTGILIVNQDNETAFCFYLKSPLQG